MSKKEKSYYISKIGGIGSLLNETKNNNKIYIYFRFFFFFLVSSNGNKVNCTLVAFHGLHPTEHTPSKRREKKTTTKKQEN